MYLSDDVCKIHARMSKQFFEKFAIFMLLNYCWCVAYTVTSLLPCYQDLQSDIHDHETNLEYINDTGKDLVQKGGNAQKLDKLKTDLTQLNQRFEGIARSIEERVGLLESSAEQVNQMNVSGSRLYRNLQ